MELSFSCLLRHCNFLECFPELNFKTLLNLSWTLNFWIRCLACRWKTFLPTNQGRVCSIPWNIFGQVIDNCKPRMSNFQTCPRKKRNLLLMIITEVTVLAYQTFGQLLRDPSGGGPQIVSVFQRPHVIFVVDTGQRSLLGLALHPVPAPGHQHVHHVQRVVVHPLQHEPPVRAVQEAGRLAPGVLLLQGLSVPDIQPCRWTDAHCKVSSCSVSRSPDITMMSDL